MTWRRIYCRYTLILLVTNFSSVDAALVISAENMMLNLKGVNPYTKTSAPLKNVLGLPVDIDLVRSTTVRTVQGVEKSRLKEMFQGKPVTGAGVEASVDAYGNYLQGAVTGTLVLNINQDLPPETACDLTTANAVRIVLEREALPINAGIAERHFTDTIFVDENNIAHRALEVELFIPRAEKRPFYVIDKCSWKILDFFDKMIRFTATEFVYPDWNLAPTDGNVPYWQMTTPRQGWNLQTTNWWPTVAPVTSPPPLITPQRNPGKKKNPSKAKPPTSSGQINTPSTLINTTSISLPQVTVNKHPVTSIPPKTVTSSPLINVTSPNNIPLTLPNPVTKSGPIVIPLPKTTMPQSYPTLPPNFPMTFPWTVNPVTVVGGGQVGNGAPLTSPAPTVSPIEVTTSSPTCPTIAVGIGGNTKTSQYTYGVPPRCLKPQIVGNQCFLENKYVKVVDLKGAMYAFRPEVANFTCTKGYLDAVNDAYSPALDAYFFATTSGRMYEEWYGLQPAAQKPLVQVHYGRNVDNAFYNPYTNVLTFGDGNIMTYPLVSMDVVSHELAHGLTTQNSNLRYKGASGGIDESFSDMAGEATEAFFKANDWLVGADLMKTQGEAFRYFDDPTKDGNSIKHVAQYTDGMDVHFSSGIFNHVFYQIVQNYGIDIKHAFEAFLRANQIYWKSNDGFVEAACGTVRAAYDAGVDVISVTEAFGQVGITPCNITTFIEKLDPAVIRSNLEVSSVIQPMFRVSVPTTSTGISITAYTVQNDVIGILISNSISRDIPPILTALNFMFYNLPSNQTRQFYIRLYTYTEVPTPDVFLSIKFT